MMEFISSITASIDSVLPTLKTILGVMTFTLAVWKFGSQWAQATSNKTEGGTARENEKAKMLQQQEKAKEEEERAIRKRDEYERKLQKLMEEANERARAVKEQAKSSEERAKAMEEAAESERRAKKEEERRIQLEAQVAEKHRLVQQYQKQIELKEQRQRREKAIVAAWRRISWFAKKSTPTILWVSPDNNDRAFAEGLFDMRNVIFCEPGDQVVFSEGIRSGNRPSIPSK